MATFTPFNSFLRDLANGRHNLSSDSLRYLLTNDAPLVTDEERADLASELGDGFGYPEHGIVLTGTSVDVDAATIALLTDDKTLTASGGAIGPFRYVVLYNRTATDEPLIAFWDRGASLTLDDTDSALLDANDTLGLFRIGIGTIA